MVVRGCCGGRRRTRSAGSAASGSASSPAAAGGYGVRLTEAVFQKRVIEAARWHGWRVVHYRPCLRQSGRRSTPVQGDKGGPDLLLARRGVVLLVELKTDTGRMSADQRKWAEQIGPGVHRLWRPADWDRIEAELAGTPAGTQAGTPEGSP